MKKEFVSHETGNAGISDIFSVLKYADSKNPDNASLIQKNTPSHWMSPHAIEILIARPVLPIRPGRSLPLNLSLRKTTNFYI